MRAEQAEQEARLPLFASIRSSVGVPTGDWSRSEKRP